MSDPKYINIGHPAMNLAEECAELVKAASKVDRFGPDNRYPDGDSTNIQKLRDEWLDLAGAYNRFLKHVLAK